MQRALRIPSLLAGFGTEGKNMERYTSGSRRGRARLGVASLTAFALLVAVSGSAQAAAVPVPLGDAESFAVLAHTGITNSTASTVWGDIGSSSPSSIGGGITVLPPGANHGGDAVTDAARVSLYAAVTQANGQTTSLPTTAFTISADLGGQVLVPGVYHQSSTMTLGSGEDKTLTLNAGGDPNAVWVFHGDVNLTSFTDTTVALAGGAQACNVYWVLGEDAALGVRTHFVGTVMAYTSVTLNTNATLDGRALAQTGNVTLLDNIITHSPCVIAGAGGVGTGDGSTSVVGGHSYTALMAATLLLGGLGGVGAAVLIRRRRIENAS